MSLKNIDKDYALKILMAGINVEDKESLKQGLQELIGGSSSEGVDWNENDETSPAFVKNRPFYKELGDVVVIPEQTPVFDDFYDNVYYYKITLEHIPNIGDECTVTLGDQHYTCIATSVDGALVLGNTSIMGIGSDTGEPFMIVVGNDPYLYSLSPIEELISCTAKSFFYNSVPMEYLDNAVRVVRIKSNSITMERANEITNSNYDLIIWGGIIFTNISRGSIPSGGSMREYISLLDIYGSICLIYYENDAFDIGTLEFDRTYYPHISNNLRSCIAIRAGENNDGFPIISSMRSYGGDATEDIMFEVENNGDENKKEFRVLGNGTVEAYSMILPSTTKGSTKQFRITVDDTGTISATEITG